MSHYKKHKDYGIHGGAEVGIRLQGRTMMIVVLLVSSANSALSWCFMGFGVNANTGIQNAGTPSCLKGDAVPAQVATH